MRNLTAAAALAAVLACAVLFLDGAPVGDPAAYDGNPGVLRVEAGTHEVEIRVDGRPTFTQRVFVESELKTVKVH